ncbi:sporulation related protein [Pontibacter mucosus]|uniref:Sporulation related protein n=1 Tax=Pontibacter mucosus TaxID=1649266 RepID=A0A2T5YLA1_9BACT|nr:SPOR domain-containing protein [Pontibacter mucosus]PTX20057.1 sporulation related protein [Pontibacter mucosus]
MVEKHIKSLLYEHDCVIIPDFGGLITRYVPARINSTKHTLSPPSKKIAFNEKLVLNDGLLISTIAYHNRISKEEAQQRVAAFVHQAKDNLQAQNRFELSDIGIFRYNPERRLVFEHTETDNMLEDSFGLPEISARPVRKSEEPAVLRTLIKERQKELEEEKQPLRRRIKRAYNVAAGLALVGLCASAVYFLSLQADYNLSSLNPVSFLKSTEHTAREIDEQEFFAAEMAGAEAEQSTQEAPETVSADAESMALSNESEGVVAEPVDEVIEEPAVEAEEAAPAHIIYTTDGRSYIISGGYARLENAEQYRNTLLQQGHEEVFILLPQPGSRLFRVSLADFDTADEAQNALNTYRKQFGETLWVLNN